MSISPEIMEETDDRMQENEFEEPKSRGEEDGDEFGLDREAEADREDDDEEEENPAEEDQTAVESEPNRKKRKDMNDRRPGELILPFSRVQRVIKADKDIPMVARDAIFLIGLATESFIAELAMAAHRVAMKEKRATVQHKDIATVVRKADEFMFLEDILPYTTLLAVPEKRSKRSKPVPEVTKGSIKHSEQSLDKFIVSNRERGAEEGNGVDVVMNEDGTMYAVSD